MHRRPRLDELYGLQGRARRAGGRLLRAEKDRAEQGQLFHFRVPLKGVAVYEDVIALWDKIIEEYLEEHKKNE